MGNSVVTQPPGVPLRQVPQVRLEQRSEHVVMRIAVASTGSSGTTTRPRRLATWRTAHRGWAFTLGYFQGLIEMMELDDRLPEEAR